MAENRPILSLSTCWCSHRHTDGYDMLKEVAGLGFEWVELSHGIRISLVPGILKAVGEGWIKVSSVHNFCPLPTGVMAAAPNLYEPSAPDARERAAWLRYTRTTLDFARRIGCDVAVLHSGSVRFFWGSPRRALGKKRADRPKEQLLADASFQRLVARSLAKVRKRSPKFRAALVESLKAIHPYAEERGVRLGLENREGMLELPIDDEWTSFLGELPRTPTVGTWHDTGHAQIKEQLGLGSHEGILATYADRLIGFHVHDVSPEGHDHQAPGRGTIDFAMLRPYVKPHHKLVLELSPRVSPDDLKAGRAHVERALGL